MLYQARPDEVISDDTISHCMSQSKDACNAVCNAHKNNSLVRLLSEGKDHNMGALFAAMDRYANRELLPLVFFMALDKKTSAVLVQPFQIGKAL